MTDPARNVMVLALAIAAACAPKASVDDREALLESDRAFAQATKADRGEGWASFFAEDGIMFPSTGLVEGRDAIRTRMIQQMADTTTLLSWEPARAELGSGGDLGYTVGRWSFSSQDSSGLWHEQSTGNYVTIWRKQPDGSWKVALDIGNLDPAKPTVGPEE